ncbi:amino acid adenylation domain-containing protein [Streptomyces cyaneofuscatus]|uniref:non-ribosomal peptide synthetase n=1 Tax=Streptomyces cyaneofuscatus TaxID=66883 RepID=UPI00386AD133|nr:amino acid adenylation domain-containing protein [Streptomyces cyaneofuscatus]
MTTSWTAGHPAAGDPDELLTAEKLKSLSAGQREHLLKLLSEPEDEPAHPLSPRQRGMWFLHRRFGRTPLYNVPWRCRVRGPLDGAVLREALLAVVRRHEVLRTRVVSDAGIPGQRVMSGTDPEALWHETDLGPLPEPERGPRAEAVASAVARQPFDMERGPLIRAELIRHCAEEHVLVLSVHHIAFDGWSMRLLTQEIWDLYHAFSLGLPSPLPALPEQYGPYSAKLDRQLRDGELDAQIAYWREQLGGAPPELELPTDRARPADAGPEGGVVDRPLERSLLRDVNALGRASRTTPFVVLMAAFTTLLHRHSGQDDMTIGVPASGRVRPETQDMIGLFVNVLPLRTRLTGRMPFGELLTATRGNVLSAMSHQDVPADVLADRLQQGRGRGRTPLFRHLFSAEDRSSAVEVPGLTLDPIEEIWTGTSKFDQNWAVWTSADRPMISVEYSRDLFDADRVERMTEQLEQVMRSVVRDPGAPLDEVEVLPARERAAITARWSGPHTDYPDRHTLHGLVEEQADRTPEAEAVRFGAESLRYAELDERADRLAHRLRGLGVEPGSPVAVCAERSTDLVVALLGVMKSGGAYLPLDPGHPAERLAFMLTDSRAQVLVTGKGGSEALPERPPGIAHIALEGDELRADGPVSRPQPTAGPDDLAYVIYTSGSTGRPKGVANTHRAICNRLAWMQNTYRLGTDDTVLQKTPAGFDVSVWEFFWPLISGARMVLAPPGDHRDPGRVRDLIVAEGVTTVHFVPSMLAAFLATEGIGTCTSLRRTICSGEELPRALAEDFLARVPGELHNLYGPTEAAVDVSHWRCRSEEPGAGPGAGVPIGRPIQNTRLHVLGPALRPQPLGVPGQLYIAGVALARGYLHRPALTAERFVPDPFGPPGSRMYATGDRARLRPDGAIEFLGRIDHQVKIRGLRIEPGEIEHALRGHPGIREAAVVVRTDEERGKLLVAYHVAREAGPGASDDELRAHLRRSLPAYMVPARFVAMAALPTSPNGKLDRAALPAPGGPAGGARPSSGEPRDEREHALAGIWSRVLGLDHVGVHDDFFDLGGNSLDVLRVTAAMESALDVRLSPSDVFDHPTVEQLAGFVGRDRPAPDGDPAVWMVRGEGEPLVLVHATGGTLACYSALIGELGGGGPVIGLRAPATVTAVDPADGLPEMATDYLAALKRMGLRPPYRLAGWSMGGVIAYEMARRSAHEGAHSTVVLIDSPPPDPVPAPRFDEADLLALYAYELGRTAGRDLGLDAARLRATAPALRTELLLERAREQDVYDPSTGPEHLLRAGEVMAANVRATAGYRPDGLFDGAVTLLRTRNGAPAGGAGRWEDLVARPLVAVAIPGDHYSCLRPPHVSATAAALRRALRDPGGTDG